jgi:hypothetical protein
MLKRARLSIWYVADWLGRVSGKQNIGNPHSDELRSWYQLQSLANKTLAYMLCPQVFVHPRGFRKLLNGCLEG